ncbi:unnamed protein product [Chrysoparadoxa australica]
MEEVQGDEVKQKLERELVETVTKAKAGGMCLRTMLRPFIAGEKGPAAGSSTSPEDADHQPAPEERGVEAPRQISRGKFHRGLAELRMDHTLEQSNVLFDIISSSAEGTLLLSELIMYCLRIQAVPWKAERARRKIYLDADWSKELKEIEDEIRAEDVKKPVEVPAASKAEENQEKEETKVLVDKGEVFHQADKFFWRTGKHIDVEISENQERNIFVISTSDAERCLVYPPCVVCAKMLDELRSKALAAENTGWSGQNTVVSLESGAENSGKPRKEKKTKEEKELEAKRARATWMAEFLLNRLVLPTEDRGNMTLAKLSEDTWDTLEPSQEIAVKGAVTHPMEAPALKKKRKSSLEAFELTQSEFRKSRDASHSLTALASMAEEQTENALGKLAGATLTTVKAVSKFKDLLKRGTRGQEVFKVKQYAPDGTPLIPESIPEGEARSAARSSSVSTSRRSSTNANCRRSSKAGTNRRRSSSNASTNRRRSSSNAPGHRSSKGSVIANVGAHKVAVAS